MEIELPDGTIAEFPDDMPQAQIEAVLSQQFGSQQPAQEYVQPAPPEGMVLDPATGAMVDTKARAAQQSSGIMGTLGDIGATAMTGVPFVGSYLDEAAGAVGGPVAQETARQRLSNFEENNPNTATGLQLAGGLSAVAPALVAGAPSAAGIGLGKATALATGAGLTEGAIYGAGEGTDAESRANEALKGGLIGGGIGAAIPGLGRVAGNAVQSLSNNKAVKAAKKELGLSKRNVALLDESLDGSPIPANGMLVDQNRATEALGGGLAAEGGDSANILTNALSARQGAAKARVNDLFDAKLGKVQNTVQFTRNVSAKRSAEAGPLYDSAFAKNFGESGPPMELDNVLNRIPQEAMKDAYKVARADGRPFGAQMVANIDAPEVTFTRMPSLEELHTIRRGLRSAMDSAYRSGSTDVATSYKGVLNDLTSIMDSVSPDYAQARKIWSSSKSVDDAFKSGRDVFKPSAHKDEVSAFMQEASQADKDAYRQGARVALQDMIDRAQNSARKAGTELSVKDVGMEKFEAVFGDKSNDVITALQDEIRFSNVSNNVAGNSRTAERQAAKEKLSGKSDSSNAKLGGVAGGVGGAVRGAALDAVNSLLSNRKVNKIAAENAELAKALTATGRDAEFIVDGIQRLSKGRYKNLPPMKAQKLALQALLAASSGRSLAPETQR